jgi:hypothetical protein
MSLYLSIHRSPGLSEEEIQGYIPDVKAGVYAEFRNLYVNLDEGYIVTVYEGESKQAIQSEFERIGWPVETMTEIQFALDRAGLDSMPS